MSFFDRLRPLVRRTGGTLACLLVAAAGSVTAQTPTVNGWYFGDGDDALYLPYDVSEHGSVLYNYLDVPTSTLYVALVVDHSVN
ncbi:MAG: hypothetical protein ACLF0P_04630, partial [Thermoanaerobaculia bacterium]